MTPVIKKIIRLNNVGLLQNSCAGGAVELAKVTAIYAENGRGKSTFTAVMRACQLADAARLNARKTIDAANPPELDLLLFTGAHVEFNGNTWTGAPPDIVIFDSEFVDENVYSGFEVRADQRQSLLGFALGDQTVQLKQRVEQLTQDIDGQTRRRTQAEKTLAAYAPPYTVKDFVALQPVPDAQRQIDALQKRIEASRSAQQLAARQTPGSLQIIQFEIQAVFDVLNRELKDIEVHAEAVVEAHLAKNSEAGFEDWVSRGQKHLKADECPFCGQGITGVELIGAYRSYFNQTYANLKREVDSLEEIIGLGLADRNIDRITAETNTNAARIEAWKDQLDLVVPTLDMTSLQTALKQAREFLLGLVSAKRLQPLVTIGTQEEAVAIAATIAAVNLDISLYNSEISGLGAKISDFKQMLAAEDPQTLHTQVEKLTAALKRQQAGVSAVVAEYQTADAERKRLEPEKAQARQQIDALMQDTLQRYQSSINRLLTSFGAEFSIEQLKPSYVGSGEPRTEYVLSVRSRRVKLGSRADVAKAHSFATTLSEADKRTLAFAFFMARLEADPQLAAKVVILDDPVSSLDRNRRHQCVQLIAGLATKCRQLIVLSHDAYFVREFRDTLAGQKVGAAWSSLLAIKRVQDGYSAFTECDIDDVCSSDYYRHHRMVADYVEGGSTLSAREVAKVIRPLLEGYYHRRFPGMIPRKLTFGHIISLVVNPSTTGPLALLRPLSKELREINEYVSQFHHDTNQSAESAPVADAELLAFARRALGLIYQNG